MSIGVVTIRIICLGVLLLNAAACGKGDSQPSNPDTPAMPSRIDTGVAEVMLEVDVQGASLAPLSAFGSTEHIVLGAVAPKQGLRRIDPGDIPHSEWIGTSEPQSPVAWQLRQLPRGQYVLLQATLAPRLQLEPSLFTPPADPLTLHFPLLIPEEGSPQYRLDISFTSNPAGGYFIDSLLSRTDAEGEVLALRLDLGAGTVVCDTDHDGDYTNEATLDDPERLGVSRLLLARLEAHNAAPGALESATYSAMVESVDMAAGSLAVRSLQRIGSSAAAEPGIHHLRFAEGTAFSRRVIDPQTERTVSVQPAGISGSGQLTLTASSFGAEGATGELWLDSVSQLELDLPSDSVVAVPLQTAALPGQPVHVTIYANETAHTLRRISRLRVSFDSRNTYLPGSLDPGDRGGGAQVADGVWSSAGSSFELPPDDRIVSGELAGGDRDYLDLYIAPQDDSARGQASGAICNFELVCHNSAALGVERFAGVKLATEYIDEAGQSRQWANCLSAADAQVSVNGSPVSLGFDGAGLMGNGDLERPYIVEAGQQLDFRVIDQSGNDVTDSPNAKIFGAGSQSRFFSAVNGVLTVPHDYYGGIYVRANLGGIMSKPESDVRLFVDHPESFTLDIDETETNIFGGCASSWKMNVVAEQDSVALHILAIEADNLHASYFTIGFDPLLYRPLDYEIEDAVHFNGNALLLPVHALHYGAEDGSLHFGLCQVNPQTNTGLDDNLVMAVLHFERMQRNYDPLTEGTLTPIGLPPQQPSALLSLSADEASLQWSPYIAGDFNQDGLVDITGVEKAEYGDLTALAVHMNSFNVLRDSPAGLIDFNWEQHSQAFVGSGEVGIADFSLLLANRGTMVQAWRLFRSAPGEGTSGSAQLLAEIPYGAYEGDAAVGRIWYMWKPVEQDALEPGDYFIVPVSLGIAGQPSQPLEVR